MRIKRLAPWMLVLVTIIWGSGFVASKAAIDGGYSSSFIMFGRFTVAALVILLCFHRKLHIFSRQEIIMSLTSGILLFASFLIQTIGLRYTTPSKNAFLTATNVVMVPFIYWIFVKKRPSAAVFFSAIICFAGVSILSVDFSEGFVLHPGDMLSLLCAFFFALHMVVLDRCAARMDALHLTFGQLMVAALCALVLCLICLPQTRADLRSLTLHGLAGIGALAILYLGLFSTCLCYFLQTHAQVHVTASKTALILCMESVFGTAFSILFGYERLKYTMVIGGMMILCSILFAQLRYEEKS